MEGNTGNALPSGAHERKAVVAYLRSRLDYYATDIFPEPDAPTSPDYMVQADQWSAHVLRRMLPILADAIEEGEHVG